MRPKRIKGAGTMADGIRMLETTVDIIGLDIYGPKGVFVGKVSNLSFDTDGKRVAGLIVDKVNPAVAEEGVAISIPYEWVTAVGDIVLLKRFPERILRDGPPKGL